MEEELKSANSRTKFTLYDIFEFMTFCGFALFFVINCIAYFDGQAPTLYVFWESSQIVLFTILVYSLVKLKIKPEILSFGIPFSKFTISYITMVLENIFRSFGYPNFTEQFSDFSHDTNIGICVMAVFSLYWFLGSIILLIQFCFFSFKSDRKLVVIRLIALLDMAIFYCLIFSGIY